MLARCNEPPLPHEAPGMPPDDRFSGMGIQPNDMLLAARAAGLRYVDPNDPAIARRRQIRREPSQPRGSTTDCARRYHPV